MRNSNNRWLLLFLPFAVILLLMLLVPRKSSKQAGMDQSKTQTHSITAVSSSQRFLHFQTDIGHSGWGRFVLLPDHLQPELLLPDPNSSLGQKFIADLTAAASSKDVVANVTISPDRRVLTVSQKNFDWQVTAAVEHALDLLFPNVPAVAISSKFDPQTQTIMGPWFVTPPKPAADHQDSDVWAIETRLISSNYEAKISGPGQQGVLKVLVNPNTQDQKIQDFELEVFNGKVQLKSVDWYRIGGGSCLIGLPVRDRANYWEDQFQHWTVSLPLELRPYFPDSIVREIRKNMADGHLGTKATPEDCEKH